MFTRSFARPITSSGTICARMPSFSVLAMAWSPFWFEPCESERDVAEEDPLDLGRLEQLGGRARQDGPAGFEHVAAVGEAQRELDVLLDEHDADAVLVSDAPHQEADLVDDAGREPEERL